MSDASGSSPIGHPLSALRSPAFVVNLRTADANCQRVLRACRARGVQLRAGLKTHKTAGGAKLMFGCLPPGEGWETEDRVVQSDGWRVNVSTLAEARFFLDRNASPGADAGGDRPRIADMNYHVAPTPDKLDEILALSQRVARFSFLVDSEELVEEIDAWAARLAEGDGKMLGAKPLEGFVKVDTGAHRAGADDPLRLAQRIRASPHLRLRGLYSFSGHSYSCSSEPDLLAVSLAERRQLRQLASQLAGLGIACEDLSAGCTPVALVLDSAGADDGEWEGITEVHPGMHVFRDLQSHQPPATPPTPGTIAPFVHARIVSVSRKLKQLRLDVGVLGLSRDVLRDGTFGRIVGHPGWKIVSLSQELAIVKGLSDADLDDPALRPGRCVKVWMPHCCLTAACYRSYWIVDEEAGSEEEFATRDAVVREVWEPCWGW
ncbi:hypothetical protein DFJ74DRAFT_774406 [Hyaloraphidium curvatum]|nr:hypothetical protein DFJ74DRAFT_774406 [Hyaloraphidium curvatum]